MGLLDAKKIDLREPALCQYDKEPCIREKCNAWMVYERQDGLTYAGCSVLFTPILLGELIVELQRNQASADKIATEVNQGFAGLKRLALNAADRRVLTSAE